MDIRERIYIDSKLDHLDLDPAHTDRIAQVVIEIKGNEIAVPTSTLDILHLEDTRSDELIGIDLTQNIIGSVLRLKQDSLLKRFQDANNSKYNHNFITHLFEGILYGIDLIELNTKLKVRYGIFPEDPKLAQKDRAIWTKTLDFTIFGGIYKSVLNLEQYDSQVKIGFACTFEGKSC